MTDPATAQPAAPMFEVYGTATGEVRDADGNLIETVSGTTTKVQVPAAALAHFGDEQLRAAGLDEASITQIRSSS